MALSQPRPFSTATIKSHTPRRGSHANFSMPPMPSTLAPQTDESRAVCFFVAGTPKGQPRPRARSLGRLGVRMYNPGTADEWKRAIAEEAERVGGHSFEVTDPLCVDLDFTMPRPRNHYRTGKYAHLLKEGAPIWHLTKPDADNLAKSSVDALVDAELLVDDRSVAVLRVTKRYAGPGESSGCGFSIVSLPD